LNIFFLSSYFRFFDIVFSHAVFASFRFLSRNTAFSSLIAFFEAFASCASRQTQVDNKYRHPDFRHVFEFLFLLFRDMFFLLFRLLCA